MTAARRIAARPLGPTPVPVLVLVLTALVALVACSADDVAPTADTSPATTVAPPVATPAPTTAPTTTTTTTTTLPARVVGDEIDAIEVSARLLPGTGDAERLLAIGADTVLATTPLSDDLDRAPVWCSAAGPDGVGVPAAGAFVVRVGSPAVDRSEGGLERFELVSTDVDPVGSDHADGLPAPATIRLTLDAPAGELESVAAEVTLNADSGAGSFRGEFPDGGVLEGAFRCD